MQLVCARKTRKNNLYLLLAFVAIAQQQGGAHARLEVAQGTVCCMHVLLHQLLQIPRHMLVILDAWAAWYDTWLPIKLTLKGVVLSFLLLISDVSRHTTSRPAAALAHTQACCALITHMFDSEQILELQARRANKLQC